MRELLLVGPRLRPLFGPGLGLGRKNDLEALPEASGTNADVAG